MHSLEPEKSRFGKAPKSFNAINMVFAINKFVIAMVHSKLLLVANIYQAIITTPAIRMNDAGRAYLATNNRLQRSFRAIRNYFCHYV